MGHWATCQLPRRRVFATLVLTWVIVIGPIEERERIGKTQKSLTGDFFSSKNMFLFYFNFHISSSLA